MARWSLCIVLVALALPARADSESERDALILRIARGERVAQSVAAFARLQRAAEQAETQERARVESAEAAAQAQRARREAYRDSLDRDLDEDCGLSVDPAHPRISPTDRRSDWGRVIDKQVVTLRAANPFAGGADETIAYYRIAGKAGTHVIRGKRRDGWSAPDLDAERGDLVLVCWYDAPTRKPRVWETLADFRAYLDGREAEARREDRARGIPEALVASQRVGAWAHKVAAPPRIVAKARWNPVHVGEAVFFHAIGAARWPALSSPFVLAALEIDHAVDARHFEVVAVDPMRTDDSRRFLIEAPPGLAHTEALQPEAHVWVILGQPRFDLALRRLVLVIEDLETSYLAAP